MPVGRRERKRYVAGKCVFPFSEMYRPTKNQMIFVFIKLLKRMNVFV